MNIADIRKDYRLQTLDEHDVADNPITQFSKWWDEAMESDITEVNAMTLATVSPEGKPEARIVLLKGFDEKGFVFFTNYESAKGKEMAANPYAALVFFWKELERQVRIEGMVEKVSAEASDAYFNSRPIGSRIGAWTSPQSQVIKNRAEIENKLKINQSKFEGKEVQRPSFWGGYCVLPTSIEFWQGRSSRLHDRLRYRKSDNKWLLERLAP
jgi:pyridoxamine 5'-phosphate oxidase